MKNKELFEEYADIKLKIKTLTARQDEIKPAILENLIGEGPEAVVELEDKGKFSWYGKRKWVYSQPVKDASDQLKKMKKEEEAKGIADYSETPVLIFT